jgi:hypothetical protein
VVSTLYNTNFTVKSLSPSHEQLKTRANIVKLAESDENVVLSVGLEIRNIFGQ